MDFMEGVQGLLVKSLNVLFVFAITGALDNTIVGNSKPRVGST